MAKRRVASVSDIETGRIHRASVDDLELILVRIGGEIHALGGTCPHHGAPLADGLLDHDRLLCPWHQSVFHIPEGTLVEPPALEGLARYPVEVDGDDVLVQVPDVQPPTAVQPTMVHGEPARDTRTVVVLGGGAAGLAAAQELRRSGFAGRLVMVSDDPHAPYDRTECSKGYLAGQANGDDLPLKPASFYADADIEQIEHRVDRVDLSERRITLPGGAVIQADGLLLATGGVPRRLEVEGADLDGVATLRSWSDSDRLAELAGGASRAAVVGASFIGMETAASLAQRGVEQVTVIAPEEVPFEAALGRRVGGLLRDVHLEKGVEFRLGRTVERFRGDGRVRSVVLDDGETVDADMVAVGIGVRPATDGFTGVTLEDDGSLLTDELLRVREGVFAAGDIATFPDWRTGRPTRIEHWRTAQQQGMTAARNLAGEVEPFRAVPFFWTLQFDAILGYVGHAPAWDEEIVHGDLEGRDFMVYYVGDGRVLAAAAMGRDRQLGVLHELMLLEREPTPQQLRDGEVDLTGLLGTARSGS